MRAEIGEYRPSPHHDDHTGRVGENAKPATKNNPSPAAMVTAREGMRLSAQHVFDGHAGRDEKNDVVLYNA